MISEKYDYESVAHILKREAIRQAGAALEYSSHQLANAEAAMDMRIVFGGSVNAGALGGA